MLALLVLAGLAAAWYATRESVHDSSPAGSSSTPVAAAAPGATRREQRRQTTAAVAQVVVPDVVGQQRDDALRTLEAQDLRGSVHDVPSDQDEGIVVAQAPRGGARVGRRAAVTINVSTGPATPVAATVTVPDVVGLSKDAADDAIRAAGLEPSTAEVPSTQPRDTVVSQSPGGGTSARRGDGVLINVSAGTPAPKGKAKGRAKHAKPAKQQKSQQPVDASVPSVTGEEEGAATADLQAAGFSVSAIDEPTADASEDGVVVEQSPPGGSSAGAGSTVTIQVGRSGGG